MRKFDVGVELNIIAVFYSAKNPKVAKAIASIDLQEFNILQMWSNRHKKSLQHIVINFNL